MQRLDHKPRWDESQQSDEQPGFDCSPSWSPDCAKVSGVTDRFGSDDVYTANPDGSGFMVLTSFSEDEFASSWSGDGTHLVFDTNHDGNWELYTIKADGTDAFRLTTSPGYDANPAWRP